MTEIIDCGGREEFERQKEVDSLKQQLALKNAESLQHSNQADENFKRVEELEQQLAQMTIELSTARRKDCATSELSSLQSTCRLLSDENTTLKQQLAQFHEALERERKPDWEKWLNELATWLEWHAMSQRMDDTVKLQTAARQLRYMATSFTLKANFVRYNLEIRKWWWLLSQMYPSPASVIADMESFMREHNIALEKPIEL